MTTVTAPVTPPRTFIPALEGMRGMAALGVVVTHVAFQTGTGRIPVLGPILERFDMAVAVFFALSGFLLWRPHAAVARGLGSAPSTARYLLHRLMRIMPAYWVVVVFVLVLLPSAAQHANLRVWVSNLLLLQVFVPLTLTDGLTQMWSLSVEVAFYLVLPLLAWLVVRLRGRAARRRVPALGALIAVSLTWNLWPVPTPDAIHADNWLPGYLPWFAAGMVLAELIYQIRPGAWWVRLCSSQPLMWALAALAFLLSATEFGGPGGLERAQPWQYAVKMLLGMIIGFGLLAPLVLRPADAPPHRWLESATALTIGRWSYGIFLWHLVVLTMVFPVFSLLPFSGHFVYVLVLTVGLTMPLAAASFALIEDPARRLARRWDKAAAARRSRRSVEAAALEASAP
ncbi:peptidoglycan/LPS O-acetylase OafA/YrhL [Nocardia neocaledoniensis]|uniref:Peptidoglycan/LPS O-acetylase OafA/YrhL n=2 Tax=Nocardia neocaledoniensis TaxID=236511 RepID=A0A317NL59_9NOCA|nr:acyltransferase [Nocardia neocaledoniensis]PWV76056.1 peptidoglycan/LPS O-acetylase OafA/YrhL [Nocardia neocaledoniensis]